MNTNFAVLTPIQFEEFCKTILENAGFEVETTKTVGDGGIDLIAIRKEIFTAGKYIVQCKRYEGSVGEPVLRDLYGVVTAEKANKGILMTTGSFTASAVAFASDKPLELIDGKELEKLSENVIATTPVNRCLLNNRSGNADVDYDAFKFLLKKDPQNLHYLGCMCDILEDSLHTPIEELQKMHNVSLSDVVESKKNTISELKTIYEKIKSKKLLRKRYLLSTAQLSFMEGDMVNALNKYLSLIKDIDMNPEKTIHKGFNDRIDKIVDTWFGTNMDTDEIIKTWQNVSIKGTSDDTRYRDYVDCRRRSIYSEADSVCKIVQNIALIYKMTGNVTKGQRFKRKIKNYILYVQAHNRIDANQYACFKIPDCFFKLRERSFSRDESSWDRLQEYKNDKIPDLYSYYNVKRSKTAGIKLFSGDDLVMTIGFTDKDKTAVKDIIRLM